MSIWKSIVTIPCGPIVSASIALRVWIIRRMCSQAARCVLRGCFGWCSIHFFLFFLQRLLSDCQTVLHSLTKLLSGQVRFSLQYCPIGASCRNYRGSWGYFCYACWMYASSPLPPSKASRLDVWIGRIGVTGLLLLPDSVVRRAMPRFAAYLCRNPAQSRRVERLG